MITGLLRMALPLQLIFIMWCGISYMFGYTKADYFQSDDWKLQLIVLALCFCSFIIAFYLFSNHQTNLWPKGI